jgi:hypothetical protein
MPEPCLEPGCRHHTQPTVSGATTPFFSPAATGLVQREERPRGRGVTVRFPVVDELLHSVSDAQGAIQGRRLSIREEALARTVFGNSVAYDRVRVLTTGIAPGTTPGNTIRLPSDFTIVDWRAAEDPATQQRPLNHEYAQLLIHEMTHVWQYQHAGPGYVTTSLGQQLVASMTRGSRNFAYAYTLNGGESFFDFAPEQQAFIVENYYAMMRDQGFLDAGMLTVDYKSNHLDADGFNEVISATQRRAEIQTELPLHEPLVRQMRQVLPPSEQDLREIRHRALMMDSGTERYPSFMDRDLQLAPAVKLLEITF